MKILALDLSTKSSGWALFEGADLKDYGLATAANADVISRIYKIVSEIQSVIMANSDISTIVIEEVRPENQKGVGNLHTHKMLMWLQAKLNFMLHDNYPWIKIEYVYPSEWRAKCGIKNGRGVKRAEAKAADIEFANNHFGLSLKSDDIADAIGIGYGYYRSLGYNWT